MTISANSYVLGTQSTLGNLKVQFDCTQFMTPEPIVYSSSELLVPYQYDTVNRHFSCIVYVMGEGLKGVFLTPFSITPPLDEEGTPIVGTGALDLWINFGGAIIDGVPRTILTIGQQKWNAPFGTQADFPKLIFMNPFVLL